MTEGAGAETEGTRTRGSIARRMLVTAAVWSAVVLVIAGWSLQALYRSETDRQLDVSISDTMRSLANAIEPTNAGEPNINPYKLPKDENFAMALSGRYWAYLIIDEQNNVLRMNRSPSFMNRSCACSACSRASAVMPDPHRMLPSAHSQRAMPASSPSSP